MGTKYPAGSIPEPSVALDAGAWLFDIDTLQVRNPDGSLLTSKAGIQMVKGTFRTVEPVAGLPHFEYFTLGSSDDPEAEDPETLRKSRGMQTLARIFRRCGAGESGDYEVDCSNAEGSQILGIVTQSVEPAERDGAPNPYAGQIRSRIQPTNWFAPGEREITPRAAPQPVAKPGPVMVKLGIGRSTAQQAATPAPATKPQAAPAKPAPKAAAVKPGTRSYTCPICQEVIAWAQAEAHVSAHSEGEGEE